MVEDQKFSDKEQMWRDLQGPQFDRKQHGGLFDRGSADSYYNRGPKPHWYPEGTGHGEEVTNLNPSEIAEYMAGYNYNERYGDKKDWG